MIYLWIMAIGMSIFAVVFMVLFLVSFCAARKLQKENDELKNQMFGKYENKEVIE